MKSTMTSIFAFAAGAAVGATVAWKLLKTHFERIAQEEIDSVKEYYSDRFSKDIDEDTVDDKPEETDTKEESAGDTTLNHREYAAILAKRGYTNYANMAEGKSSVGEETYPPDEGPYVIAPNEFGSRDDYDTISLTYYSDGVLADDMDEPVTDINNVVGLESLDCFGDYEEDCVFVRNDTLKADYEILADTRRYSDVAGSDTEV